jgi:glycine C-acetyltransferase
MSKELGEFLAKELNNLEAAGLLQDSPVLTSPQQPQLQLGKKNVVGFASDNYLGFASDERLAKAASDAAMEWGSSFASGRLASGTHTIHRKLETELAKFLKVQDAAVYATGYQANLGIFENLFNEQDFIFCDFSLHPSLVDGIRFSLARHHVFRTQDLRDLEDKLKRSANARFRAIVIDAVAPQDGKIAPLKELLELAERYDALTVLDDSHGIGVLGATGRGLTEELGLLGKVDLITGSLSHALGATGGFVAGRQDILSWLRQKSRTYLFSASPPPSAMAAALKALELLDDGAPELEALKKNTAFVREGLAKKNHRVVDSIHPIISIVVGNALTAQKTTNRLFREGFYVLGYCYPVVPRDSARVRLQITAAHLKKDLEKVVSSL